MQLILSAPLHPRTLYPEFDHQGIYRFDRFSTHIMKDPSSRLHMCSVFVSKGEGNTVPP